MTMRILAIESSAKSAGVALTDGEKLICESFLDAGFTHSKTLLAMVDDVLELSGSSLESVEGIAVNSGPGSFTGIRIAAALVKGLAFKNNIPVCGVSTLESIAYNFRDEDCLVCPCIDARCERVYTSLFRCSGGRVERLKEDTAATVDGMREMLDGLDEKIYIAGDGAGIYFDKLRDIENVFLPSERRRLQNAYSVALASTGGEFRDSSELVPVYLRLSQAERERNERRMKDE